MSTMTKNLFAAAALAALLGCAQEGAVTQSDGAPQASGVTYGLGTDVSSEELQGFVSPHADGEGLPPGSGTVAQGQKVYDAQCAVCHGANLEGGGLGDRLIGGRGTLASDAPVKTVESYWPYATTLFDYIKRAMPFTAPGSLGNDDVYAVTAYILNRAQIVPADAVMSQDTLAEVRMPVWDGYGFTPAER